MAARPLRLATPKENERFYVDTSAIFPLAHAEAKAAGGGGEATELSRAVVVVDFLNRAARVSAEVRTTAIVFEELGAKVRNKIRMHEASKYSLSWQALKAQRPTEAAAADAIAHVKMLAFMKWAADGAAKGGILLEGRAMMPADVLAREKKLRKAHRELLAKYASLDAMDALHIVIGLEMAIPNFITFDAGWDAVPGIAVFGA